MIRSREVGVTFVYVTHYQEEALTMSDAIAVMSGGVLQQVGTPDQVYERPVNAFVAGFIGMSNLLSATAGRSRRAVGQRAHPGRGDAAMVPARAASLVLGPTGDDRPR